MQGQIEFTTFAPSFWERKSVQQLLQGCITMWLMSCPACGKFLEADAGRAIALLVN